MKKLRPFPGVGRTGARRGGKHRPRPKGTKERETWSAESRGWQQTLVRQRPGQTGGVARGEVCTDKEMGQWLCGELGSKECGVHQHPL